MAEPSPGTGAEPRTGVSPALAVFLIALASGLLLFLVLDSGPWGSALGAVFLTALAVTPRLLWNARLPRTAKTCAVLLPALLLPLSTATGDRTCVECGSHCAYREWGWGIGSPWIRIPRSSELHVSHAGEEYFAVGHAHAWRSGDERLGGAFGVNTLLSGGWISCGWYYPSEFGRRFEDDGAFRGRIGERVRAGDVTADQVRLLLSLPGNIHRVGTVPPGTHALLARAGAWLGRPLWYGSPEFAWPPEGPAPR